MYMCNVIELHVQNSGSKLALYLEVMFVWHQGNLLVAQWRL